jgi:hypothetical protein
MVAGFVQCLERLLKAPRWSWLSQAPQWTLTIGQNDRCASFKAQYPRCQRPSSPRQNSGQPQEPRLMYNKPSATHDKNISVNNLASCYPSVETVLCPTLARYPLTPKCTTVRRHGSEASGIYCHHA